MTQSPPQKPSLSKFLSVLVSLALLGLSAWTIRQEFRTYPPAEILKSLAKLSGQSLWLAIGIMLLNYIMLTGYDVLAIRSIRRSLAYNKIALVSVISYAISNCLGFALLSGSAIRYRFYTRWQFSEVEIAQIIAFANLSFWLGLLEIGGVLFLIEPLAIPALLHLPFKSLHLLAFLFLALVLGYVLWNVIGSKRSLHIGKWTLPHLPWPLAIAQMTNAACDWALAAATLYVILPASPHLTSPAFFAIFLLAQLAGLISNIPGGLGVFETVILLLLSHTIATPNLLGALLAYRGIYYILPLGVGILLLGLSELKRW
jgi:uncharacterized membrane protein YbhN (UPF0104 family)